MALHMIAEAQKAGGIAAFIDAEHADMYLMRKRKENPFGILIIVRDVNSRMICLF